MFIVMPSDPTTVKAADFLETEGIKHTVMPIPEELGYKTTATIGIYLEGSKHDQTMLKLSAKGFVIMRVFKQFELC